MAKRTARPNKALVGVRVPQPTDVKLYLDFGTAYIKAGVELPGGELRPLKFSGQNALPAYIRLVSPVSPTSRKSEVFVGHDARDLSGTSTDNVVFYPTLLLRGPVDSAGMWTTNYPSRIPFQPCYTVKSNSYKIQMRPNGSLSVIELMQQFIKLLRDTCQEQIIPDYNITDCVVTMHDIVQTKDEFVKAFENTGFQRVTLRDRTEAELAGLMHHFPHLLYDKPYVVVVRMGAAFSSLSIHSLYGREAGVTRMADNFGGNDIDALLLEYCLAKFQETYGLHDEDYTPDDMHRLRLNCETMKIQLSTANQVTLPMLQFHKGHDLAVGISIDIFREIIGKACYKVIKKFASFLENYFSGSGREHTYELILLGNSTKILFIQEIVTLTMQKPNQQVRNFTRKDSLVVEGMNALRSFETVPQSPGVMVKSKQPGSVVPDPPIAKDTEQAVLPSLPTGKEQTPAPFAKQKGSSINCDTAPMVFGNSTITLNEANRELTIPDEMAALILIANSLTTKQTSPVSNVDDEKAATTSSSFAPTVSSQSPNVAKGAAISTAKSTIPNKGNRLDSAVNAANAAARSLISSSRKRRVPNVVSEATTSTATVSMPSKPSRNSAPNVVHEATSSTATLSMPFTPSPAPSVVREVTASTASLFLPYTASRAPNVISEATTSSTASFSLPNKAGKAPNVDNEATASTAYNSNGWRSFFDPLRKFP